MMRIPRVIFILNNPRSIKRTKTRMESSQRNLVLMFFLILLWLWKRKKRKNLMENRNMLSPERPHLLLSQDLHHNFLLLLSLIERVMKTLFQRFFSFFFFFLCVFCLNFFGGVFLFSLNNRKTRLWNH